jgi:hypothetical protein
MAKSGITWNGSGIQVKNDGELTYNRDSEDAVLEVNCLEEIDPSGFDWMCMSIVELAK